MTATTIIEMAPAKVNLYLRICGRRDDGYHLLDSAVIFTAFGDQISLTPASTDSLTVTGAFATILSRDLNHDCDTPDGNAVQNLPSSNICMQALNAFRHAGGLIAPLNITLDKRIPVGAGLGGGSADAGAMLRALNAHADTPVTTETLHAIATSLGADVPACLRAHSLRMTGIGDQITPLTLSATKRPDANILLANPLIPLATKDVFATLHTNIQEQDRGHAGDISQLGATALVGLGNDLAETAIKLVPEIATLLTLLRQQRGCQIAAMSGSGASCFALFDSAKTCQQAETVLGKSGIWAEATHII
jgi:4-diphosphocytidyl-2-C-methyl-D-erythritol kinase